MSDLKKKKKTTLRDGRGGREKDKEHFWENCMCFSLYFICHFRATSLTPPRLEEIHFFSDSN